MPIRLNGSTSGHIELAAPAVAGSTTLELPTDSIKPGLVLVAQESFTTQSTVSVDDCFTSEYDNYRLFFSLTSASTTASAYLRLRASGSDITSAHYAQMSPGLTSGNAVSSSGNGGQTAWEWGTINTAGMASIFFDVLLPHVSTETRIGGASSYYNGSVGIGRAIQGFLDNSTIVDGVTFYPGSGNYTGSLSIYGYRSTL